jgi:hypothetical protein
MFKYFRGLMYETQEVLLDTPLIRVTSAVDKSGPSFSVYVIEDCTDREKVSIYVQRRSQFCHRRDLVKLAALLIDEVAKQAELPAATADNCRDCDENNSGVTL